MSIATIAALITELAVLIGVIVPVIRAIHRITDGQKCQLRSEMLRIYYRHKDTEKLRQYELENFIMLYNAYKALGGNSFIDKIHTEVLTWDVIT